MGSYLQPKHVQPWIHSQYNSPSFRPSPRENEDQWNQRELQFELGETDPHRGLAWCERKSADTDDEMSFLDQ